MESTGNEESYAKCVNPNKSLVATKNKKNRKMRKFRNIILNPTEEFWPSLNFEENNRFHREMERVILTSCTSSSTGPKSPWYKMGRLTKVYHSYLTIGLNEIAREKDLMFAVVLDNEVDPKFMIEHMIYLFAHKGVTVLIVNSLPKLTEALFGVSSVSLGFKKEVETIHHLHDLCKLIKELGKAHEPPNSFRNFCEPVPDLNESKMPQPSDVTLSQNDRKQECNKSNSVSRFYLLKPSNGRAFIPKSQNKEINNQNIPNEESKKKPAADFISISAGITADKDDDMEYECRKGISSTVLREENCKGDIYHRRSNYYKGSSAFIRLKYVEVQPKPKRNYS